MKMPKGMRPPKPGAKQKLPGPPKQKVGRPSKIEVSAAPFRGPDISATPKPRRK